MPKKAALLCGVALFFIPYRRHSRFSVRRLVEAWRSFRDICKAIDDLTSDLPEEFYIPVSTAVSYLLLILKVMRMNHTGLGIDPTALISPASLFEVDEVTLDKIFSVNLPWLPVPLHILVPP